MAALMRKKHYQKCRSLSFKLEKGKWLILTSYFTEDSLLSFSSKAYLSQPLKRPLHYFLISNSFLFAATIIMDKGKNRSKDCGYVAFSTEEEAQKALADMNGKLLDGRVIFVDNVRPSRRYNIDAPLARQCSVS